MLPLALALDEGGEIQAPMGRAIIGGVITSTLLTLVVVPVLYSYLVRDRQAEAARETSPAASLASGGAGAHAGVEGLSRPVGAGVSRRVVYCETWMTSRTTG